MFDRPPPDSVFEGLCPASPSFKTLEIVDQRLQIGRVDSDRRHVIAGLHALRIDNPARQIALRVRHGIGSDASADFRSGSDRAHSVPLPSCPESGDRRCRRYS